MKKVLLIAAMLTSMSAFATGPSNNNGDTTNNTTNNSQTYNQGGTGGQGGVGYGGNASAAAGAIAGAAAVNKNDIKNTNQQAQGQQQGQAQGQSQSVKNSGNSSSSSGVVGSGNSSSNSGGNSQSNAGNNASTSVSVGGDTYESARIPVATAYAPSIAPTAPCMGSTSGGAQVAGFGFSAGGTWTDDNCVLLEQVRAVSNLGDKETATEMMMGIPAYAAAKKRLADRKSGKAPTVSNTEAWDTKTKTATYNENDPIIRSRLGLPPLAGK